MEAALPSEIFVTSKLHIPDHRVLNIHLRENMKPHLSPGTKDTHNGTKFTQLSAGNTVAFHSLVRCCWFEVAVGWGFFRDGNVGQDC